MRCDCCEAELSDFDTDELEYELRQRYSRRGVPGWTSPREELVEIVDLLQRSKTDEALSRLRSFLFPKWSDPMACKKDYDRIRNPDKDHPVTFKYYFEVLGRTEA